MQSSDKISFLRGKLCEFARGRKMSFMEVCGTHTVAIFRSGLRSLLPPEITLLSGPGCPVCVTPQCDIDAAISLANEGKILATYGDMIRVPGSGGESLAKLRGNGADVRVVTNAMQCIEIANEAKNAQKKVVFFGVGFETTAPATAVLIKEAARQKIKNLSVYSVHKTIPEALKSLSSDGFILPGNVSVIIGEEPYKFIAAGGRPCVIAGFDAENILAAIVELARQVAENSPELKNFYTDAVKKNGNPQAQKIISEIFENCDSEWRGLGIIKNSGLKIKDEFANFDAKKTSPPNPLPINGEGGQKLLSFPPSPFMERGQGGEVVCRCGDILTGKITPPECSLFGSVCTPMNPVGACMVSGEGTCGAWYRWNRKF